MDIGEEKPARTIIPKREPVPTHQPQRAPRRVPQHAPSTPEKAPTKVPQKGGV
jgi:hypothetical protein